MDHHNALILLTFFSMLDTITAAMKYLEARKERVGGELTITGTRITVSQVINMLANGFTIEELHTEWFPHLSPTTLKGAVAEATQLLRDHVHAERVL
jgi:uncharacterized protein (DUF433 family)